MFLDLAANCEGECLRHTSIDPILLRWDDGNVVTPCHSESSIDSPWGRGGGGGGLRCGVSWDILQTCNEEQQQWEEKQKTAEGVCQIYGMVAANRDIDGMA